MPAVIGVRGGHVTSCAVAAFLSIVRVCVTSKALGAIPTHLIWWLLMRIVTSSAPHPPLALEETAASCHLFGVAYHLEAGAVFHVHAENIFQSHARTEIRECLARIRYPSLTRKVALL